MAVASVQSGERGRAGRPAPAPETTVMLEVLAHPVRRQVLRRLNRSPRLGATELAVQIGPASPGVEEQLQLMTRLGAIEPGWVGEETGADSRPRLTPAWTKIAAAEEARSDAR